MKYKSSLFLILFLAVFLVSAGVVSAFEFDNVGNYNLEKREMTITNALGLGSEIAKIKLITPDVNHVATGYSRVAELDFTTTKYKNVFNDMDFKNLKSNSNINRAYDYKLRVKVGEKTIEDYDWTCNKTGDCYDVYAGTHQEDIYEWRDMDESVGLEEGTHRIGIYAQVLEGDYVDWVPTLYGEKVDEWAVWTAGLNNGLVLYYNMSEEGGTTAYDNSGAPILDGTAESADVFTSLTPGILDLSANFSVANSIYIDNAVINSTLAPDAEYTISMWIKTSTPGSVTSAMGMDTGGNNQIHMAMNTDGYFNVVIGGTGSLDYNGAQNGEWNHVVITNDGGSTGKIFVNGTERDTNTPGSDWAGSNRISWGDDNDGGNSYTGLIDEVAIWNRTLTDGEIIQLYNNGTGMNPESTIESIEVIMNIPTASQSLSNQTVTFNTTSNSPYGVRNLTLYINGIANESFLNTTANQNLSFQRLLTLADGTYNWSVLGDDGTNTFQNETRTFTIDTSFPEITTLIPNNIVNYHKNNTNLSITWTSTGTTGVCKIGYANLNQTVTCGDNNSSINITDYNDRTLIFFANDSAGNSVANTTTWSYDVFEVDRTYNSSSYETAQESFTSNIIYNNTAYTSATASLVYKSTNYSSTLVGSGAERNLTNSISLPTGAGTNYFNYSYALTNATGTKYITSATSSQEVNNTVLGLCNATNSVPYINFTFKDEDDSSYINGSIEASAWTYWAGSDASVNKSFIFVNNTDHPSYGFCSEPVDRNISHIRDIDFASTGYPQRKNIGDGVLSNTTFNKILWLLASADGIYTTLTISDSLGTELSGVDIVVKRSFSGVFNITDYGTTDDAGTATFWVNPDFTHQFILTKDGCTDKTYTVTPTLSTYSVEMSCADVPTVDEEIYSSYVEGITYLRNPESGINEPGETNFTFYVYSSLNNLEKIKFQIVYLNGSVATSQEDASCSSDACLISKVFTTSDNNRFKGRYYAQTTNSTGYILLEADAYWRFIESNISDQGTLRSFMFNFRNLFDEWGSDTRCGYTTNSSCNAATGCKWVSQNRVTGEELSYCIPSDEDNKGEFSRIIAIFFLMAIFYAILNKFTNLDALNPGAIIWFVTFVVWIGSVSAGQYGTGFFNFSGLFGYGNAGRFLNNYLLAIILTFLSIGYGFSRTRRES